MPGPFPYVLFPGTAREALSFYGDVFGCAVQLHTFTEFGRTDGPPDAIAHGYLSEGPITLFGADAAGDEAPVQCQGLLFSLLGTAREPELRAWFSGLSQGGQVIEDLQERAWGAFDGQVRDRFGLRWLVGFGKEA
jgi:PhnB protein